MARQGSFVKHKGALSCQHLVVGGVLQRLRISTKEQSGKRKAPEGAFPGFGVARGSLAAENSKHEASCDS